MANYNLLGSSPAGFVAGGTIPVNTLVMLDSTAGQVVVTTAITSLAVGAAMNSAVSGGTVSVQQYGIAKLTAKSAIALGDQVMPVGTGGGLIDNAAGATAKSIGVALEAALAEGDVIAVMLAIPPVFGPANS